PQNRIKLGLQGFEITHGLSMIQPVEATGGRGPARCRLFRLGAQPRFARGDLRGRVIEFRTEVLEPFLGCPRLPLSDYAILVPFPAQPYRTVGVDSAEVGWRGLDWVHCHRSLRLHPRGGLHLFGHGTRAGAWARLRAGGPGVGLGTLLLVGHAFFLCTSVTGSASVIARCGLIMADAPAKTAAN